MTSKSLGDFISVRGRFHRSVNLVYDWRQGLDLTDYVVTPAALELAEQVLTEIGRPHGTRAWSLTGPYGSGKSALALFLTDILASKTPALDESRALRKRNGIRAKPLVPVLTVAERQPLQVTLANAFADAFARIDPGLSKSFRRHAKQTASAEQLTRLAVGAADVAKKAGYGGVLVIVDELGKLLEYAADTDLDLFILQQLAEGAARSTTPFVLLTILHAGFADYLPVTDDIRRQEWHKVQGRYRDVPFHLPAEQLLGLVGHSIEKRWPREIRRRWHERVDSMLQNDSAFAEAARRLQLRDLFYASYPFQPITALLLWPLFRSKLAQNERSLFAFLTSFEPHGFREFLSQPVGSADELTLFQPWHLYDYVAHALGIAAFRGEQARKWSLVEHAIGRIAPDAPHHSTEIVKTVGLIGMYGGPVGLRPSPGTLKVLFGKAYESAVAYLEDRSILVYRRHADSYALWEGSDVDLDTALAEASARVGAGELAGRFRRAVSLRPVVARAHYIESGTLRLYDVDVVPADAGALLRALETEHDQDGRILYVVGGQPQHADGLIDQARRHTACAKHALTIVGFPHASHGLEDALRELESWLWVRDNTPALIGDPVARQEVRARVVAAQERLERVAGGIFGLPGHVFEPSMTTWIVRGETRQVGSAIEFQRLLSRSCHAAFDKSPRLRNELINRGTLSSAVSAARRNLLERMIRYESAERLGIQGMPPEAAIYASTLFESGIHAKREGRWTLGYPTKADWQPIWDKLEESLDGSEIGRKSLRALYDVLERPPYGLREGPASLIICASIIAKRDEVALYEDGLFVSDIRIEVLERLIRRPETFAAQSLRLGEEHAAVLRALRQLLVSDENAGDAATPRDRLVPIARALVVAAAQLNTYTRRTTRLRPPEAARVRQTLLQAKDPRKLLFEDLPSVLNVDITDETSAREFAKKLYEAIGVLGRAYQDLLDSIEQRTREVFGLKFDGLAAWQELRERLRPLQFYTTDRGLKLFVAEVLNDALCGDWREVVGRAVRGGVPPSNWGDVDVDDFQIQVREIAAEAARLATLAQERERTSAQQIVRIDVLDGSSGGSAPVVIPITEDIEREARGLVAELQNALTGFHVSKDNGHVEEIRLAALATVAVSVLQSASQRQEA